MKLRLPGRSWSLPLLAKELVEQANRRRTYGQRLAYAIFLFGFWLLALRQMYQISGEDHLQILGRGYELFSFVVGVQLAAVYLFLPAMLAGSITQEKENNTLQLLLITDLRPWQILVQKLLSRVLPLLALFFLALPLTAMAYLFGGVDVNQVWASVYLLAVTAMQVGAVSVLVAVHCRTTVSAVLACYLLGPVIYLMALFANVVVGVMFWGVIHVVIGDTWGAGDSDFGQRLLTNAFPFVPMFVPGAQELWVTFAGSIPVWFVTLFMLWMARDALGSGATSDSPMEAASIQTGPAPAIPGAGPGSRRVRALPHDHPIAWQQTTSLAGNWQTLAIAFSAALLSAIGMYLAAATGRSTDAPAEVARVLMMLAWPVVVMVLIVTAARTTSTERSRQTLDVLLTTPMSGADILRQKLAAVRRWMYAAMALLIALALMRSGWQVSTSWAPRSASISQASPLYTLVRDVLAAVIYLPLFVWFAALLGLCIHSPAKATLTTIAVTAGWCVGGVGLTEFFIGLLFPYDREAYRWLMLISPMGIAVAYREGFWALLVLNFIGWGAARVALAWWCLRRADELLGRPKLDPPQAAAARAAEPPGAEVAA